jgi:hypothetical protein
MSYLGMKKILELDCPGLNCPSDYFVLTKEKIGWAEHVAGITPLLFLAYRLTEEPHITVLMRRFGCMYLLKGLIQTVTLIPIPTGTDMCVNRTFLGMIIEAGNCSDMMFSGHTALAYIMVPKKLRWVIVPFVGVMLLFAKMHYMSDIIVAVLVAQWLEFQFPMPSEQNKRMVLEVGSQDGKKNDDLDSQTFEEFTDLAKKRTLKRQDVRQKR